MLSKFFLINSISIKSIKNFVNSIFGNPGPLSSNKIKIFLPLEKTLILILQFFPIIDRELSIKLSKT